MASEHAAPEHAALAALDAALRDRPAKDGHAFADATQCLVAFRNRLTERRRAGEDVADALEQVNAIISVVLGGHFPLGAVPWPAVEGARAALAKLIGGAGGSAGANAARAAGHGPASSARTNA